GNQVCGQLEHVYHHTAVGCKPFDRLSLDEHSIQPQCHVLAIQAAGSGGFEPSTGGRDLKGRKWQAEENSLYLNRYVSRYLLIILKIAYNRQKDDVLPEKSTMCSVQGADNPWFSQ